MTCFSSRTPEDALLLGIELGKCGHEANLAAVTAAGLGLIPRQHNTGRVASISVSIRTPGVWGTAGCRRLGRRCGGGVGRGILSEGAGVRSGGQVGANAAGGRAGVRDGSSGEGEAALELAGGPGPAPLGHQGLEDPEPVGDGVQVGLAEDPQLLDRGHLGDRRRRPRRSGS